MENLNSSSSNYLFLISMGLKVRSVVYALATYTIYTTYSYARAREEISFREKEYTKREINDEDHRWDILNIHGRYENPFKEYRPQTIYEFFIMRVIELSKFGSRGGVEDDVTIRKDNLGIKVTDSSINFWKSLRDKCKESGLLAYTWFGQSCGIVNSSDKIFLMDPLFENSIVSEKFGPKRIVPCVVNIDEIVEDIKPDYVLVSHDHPDHLGEGSIRGLSKLEKCEWIVPMGIRDILENNGIKSDKIIEMKWWDRNKLNEEFEIVCLPAMHWSGRMLYDSNKSLWCSFLILKNGKSIFYHGGDTGYSEGVFKRIGDIYGPIKFAALPIGQYCPEWHQAPRHISPSESIKIMNEMKIHKMVGVHWGTFVLSSENYLEPGQLLKKESENLEKINNIIVPVQGQSLIMEEGKIDFNNDDLVKETGNDFILYN